MNKEEMAGKFQQTKKYHTAFRFLFWIGGALAVLTLILFVVSFLRYANEVSAVVKPNILEHADGIVVFTGGKDRISGAMSLLAQGYGQRLLISGVHPQTSQAMLAKLAGGRDDLFGCCIELGRRARDTIGNAEETSLWVRAQGFSSLIVVTSGYHMPRSLVELSLALPDVKLVGHAVPTSSIDLSRWWLSLKATSLLLGEYVKLVTSRLRVIILSMYTHRRLPAQHNHMVGAIMERVIGVVYASVRSEPRGALFW